MKFCHQCGNLLVLGTEIYCPACGTKQFSATESSSSGASSATTTTEVSGTSGDVIGSATSGMGNIIGKEVAYTVSGNVINLHVQSISTQTLQELKDIILRPDQLETKADLGEQTHRINTEFTNLKANEVRITKQTAEQVLDDIDQIGRKKGVHIEQIKVEELQVSRTELQLKDIISEGNEYYYKGEYRKAIQCYDRASSLDNEYVDAWNNKGNTLDDLGRYDEAYTVL